MEARDESPSPLFVVERNRMVVTYPPEIMSRVMTFRWHL